jgi:hypothetical protein
MASPLRFSKHTPSRDWKYKYLVLMIWILYGYKLKLWYFNST